ncbi:MAG: hypothetical protein WCE90_08610 [Candidatus Zixiibacteriota bacterium]
MLKTTLVWVIISLCAIPAWSAFDNCGSSAKTLSLGNASTALTDEPSVILTNPGGLGFLRQKGFQTSLSRLFDVDELSEREIYLAFPLRRFSLGAGFYQFGKKAYYEESVFCLALAYEIGDHFSLGTSLKHMRASFSSEYDGLSAASIDAGSDYRVNDRFQVGLAAHNLNRPHLVKGSDDIPANFCLGIAVFPFSEATLSFDLTYDERYREQLHVGQEIMLVKNLPLRFGLQTSPARYALGIGLDVDKFTMDYAYLSHSVLGNTHKLSLSYWWGKKASE